MLGLGKHEKFLNGRKAKKLAFEHIQSKSDTSKISK